MMSAREHADTRKKLENKLRGPLSEVLWDFLDDRGYIHGIEFGDYTVSEVASEVRTLRKAVGASRRSSGISTPVFPKATAARQAALGAIYADQADRDSRVVNFRKLTGPLRETQVLGWVAAKHYASLNLMPDASPQDEAIGIGNKRIEGHAMKNLSYLDGQRRCLVSVVDPILVKLAELSEALSKRWCFPEEEVTNFILTGRTPTVWRYRGKPLVHPFSFDNATSRIVLEVDPDMSPAEVAEAYRKLRSLMKGTRARVRPVKERTAVLAGWVVKRKTEEMTWKAARLAWNHEYPEWSCRSDTNFARDSRAAIQRLSYPGWQYSSPPK